MVVKGKGAHSVESHIYMVMVCQWQIIFFLAIFKEDNHKSHLNRHSCASSLENSCNFKSPELLNYNS